MTISAEDYASGNYPKGVPITVIVGGDAHGRSTAGN